MDKLIQIKELISQYPWLLALIAVVFICGLIVVFRRRSKSARKMAPEKSSALGRSAVTDKDESSAVGIESQSSDATDEERIAEFFIRIFKAQLGAPKSARYKLKELDSTAIAPRKTYELEVLHNSEWSSRRMTVGPVGGESASRSKCYHVIFDHHLIIKIPPKPITDFDIYLDSIEADHEVVKALAPRECIVPTVSAVMKLIHPLSNANELTPEELEEKYLTLLRKFDAFQNFLIIGPTFVQIMDLSKYFFLSNIVDDFHDLYNKMYEEIVGYPDVVWENHGFEGRYAFEDDEEIQALRGVYTEYEERLSELVQAAEQGKAITRYSMQQWFLIHLCGRKLGNDDQDVTPELAADIDALTEKVFKKHSDIIESYRNTIRGCIQSVTIGQNKEQIGGIIKNILDLLAWLQGKGVAIRDLKPDNLLVAGDQTRYPEFLNSTKDYTIGLIDLETAAVCEHGSGHISQQPILGGTPSYATPSHLVLNEVLDDLYEDVARILYLQDWYAAIGMIYEVITGETLFHKTGKMIIGIKTAMFKHIDSQSARQGLYKKASRMFWHNASAEIAEKMRDKEDLLRSVLVVTPDDAKELFRQALAREKRHISDRMKHYIINQNVFKGDKGRKGLLAASRKKITLLMQDIKKKQSNASPILTVLKGLEDIKQKAENQKRFARLFEKEILILSAHDLMGAMFDIVLHEMHRSDWGDLLAAEVVGVKGGGGTTTVDATV
jgi:hypothetical protein